MNQKIIDKGIDEAKIVAKDLLDKIDVNELINIAIAFITKKKSIEDIEKEYGPKVKEAVLAYAKNYSKDSIEKIINVILNRSKNNNVNKLADEDFSKEVVDAVLDAKDSVKKYLAGDINVNEFMSILANSDLTTIALTLFKAYGVDVKQILDNLDTLKKMPMGAASIAALTEAYNIYMKCLNDASIQHDQRVLVEKRVQESIKAIKEYRKQMEEDIIKYFDKHYDAYEEGIIIMNQALIDNDSDGYIKGNNVLQQVLGYKSQFNNQKEFDSLMESDEDFKL